MAKGRKPTTGEVNARLSLPKWLKSGRGNQGDSFPLRVALVTRVDAKRMVVDVKPLSGGSNTPYQNVPLSFPGAGARHFLGAIPEVGDMCVIGSAQSESGSAKRPMILGWFVPSTQAGYDWLNVRSHAPNELGLTPQEKVALEGMASQRRHKLRQMEVGHLVASSAQGSDLLLTESATLANRRGNEVILRDQDQALVVRSLQQFHAGAGFRTYSGMIQRDANLLPSQMFQGDANYASDRQVDSAGLPLPYSEWDDSEEPGILDPAPALLQDVTTGESKAGLIFPNPTDPYAVLKRGLFIDGSGSVSDGVTSGAVYGGKPMYRVSTDWGDAINGVDNDGVDVFTEYRIEVAHTSDGTLPVTEQTDGIDIDRLPPKEFSLNPGATGGADPVDNRSSQQPMVEFVLGTVVGNDPFNARDEYGVPLVAKITTKGGKRETVIRGATDADKVSDHLAFMLRLKNPEKPDEESFIAMTKGGVWMQNFAGKGSAGCQEAWTGKQSFYGTGGRKIDSEGAYVLNASGGRPEDNVAVDISSANGCVEIFGGGSNTAGGADGSTDSNNSPAGKGRSLSLRAAKSAVVEAADVLDLSAGGEINIKGSGVTNIGASSSCNINSGDTVALTTKKFPIACSGQAEWNFAGPLDGNATNGTCRSVTFPAMPATGAVGGDVDTKEVVFGNVSHLTRSGRIKTVLNVGEYFMRSMATAIPTVGPGAGFDIGTGLPLLDNVVKGTPASLKVQANAGNASVKATKGQTTVSGIAGTAVRSASNISIRSAYVALSGAPYGGMLNDGVLCPVSGRTFLSAGCIGVPTVRNAPG